MQQWAYKAVRATRVGAERVEHRLAPRSPAGRDAADEPAGGHPPAPFVPFPLAPGQSIDEVRRRAQGRRWFHTFEFADPATGEQWRLEGYDPTLEKLKIIGLPERLDGMSVLDIGTYDGFFALESARRGGDVLATDSFSWLFPGEDAYGNFHIVLEATGLAVREQTIAVEDLSPEATGGPFDVVLFFGVLYHAPDPLGYMRRVRSVTKGHALVETVVDLLDIDRPALAYYPGAYLNGDPTNHFGPNLAAVEGLAIDAGFSRVEHLATWSPDLVEHLTGRPTPEGPPRSGRAVFRCSV